MTIDLIDLHVHICTASAGTPKPRFAMALSSMVAHYITHRLPFAHAQTISFNLVENAMVCKAREELAERALQRGASHILFVDDDMTFAPASLCGLLAHRKPIVAANYRMRKPGGDFVAGNLAGDGRAQVTAATPDLEEVAFCGFGLCLIAREVLEALEFPRFPIAWNEDRQDYVGEDVMFCMRAREEGFSTFIDHRISRHTQHIGQFSYRWDYTPDPDPESDSE